MSGSLKTKNSDQTVYVTLTKEQSEAIITYATRAQELLFNQLNVRTYMTEVDKQYQREKNWTPEQLRARIANRVGDAHKIQDITVPIVMPQVDSATSYLTNVFLTGYPIFGVSSNPMNEDTALMLETIIAENSITAGWVPEIMMFFRDGLKYNLHALECTWDQKTVWKIETDATKPNSASPKKVNWNGNVIRRLDLYNSFWDYRVHPAELSEFGEYAGYTRLYSRTRMKQYINDMYGEISGKLAREAFESPQIQMNTGSGGQTPFSYFQPIINPFPTLNSNNSMQGFNWDAWANGGNSNNPDSIAYRDAYTHTTLYARIIPKDFNIQAPGENTPQVWKFVIINGKVVISAARQTNAHSNIPILMGQPLSDGLDYQTKSFADNVVPMQDVASALWSGFLASKRRLVTDRVIYDPSKIRASDINSPNPSAKIPVRPSAYGKNIAESVYQFPYRDEQANSMIAGAKEAVNFANMINSQNPAQQGQFVKGNKTKREYEDVMGHGNGTNQMMALTIEAQVFTPMKEILKLNMMQYQQNGEIFNSDKRKSVQVDQQTLRQTAVQFKVSDGIIPTEKEMDTDEFQVALQTIGSAPQIGSKYNLGPMFTYIMKIRGADLTPFEKPPEQVMYEQQMEAWQQAAAGAAKAGTAFSTPMPQPSQQLQQMLQAAQQTGGTNPQSQIAKSTALASTQGSGD